MLAKDIQNEKKDIELDKIDIQEFNLSKNTTKLTSVEEKVRELTKKSLKRRKRKNKKKIFRLFKNVKRYKIFRSKYRSIFRNKFDFRLTANNIFGTFSLLKKNKIIHSASAGMYKIETSRKRMKYTHRKFADTFINKIKQKYKKNIKSKIAVFRLNKSSILNITAIKRVHKRVVRKFRKAFRLKGRSRKPFLILINSKKCFNGCRVSKKRRKKRLRFRIFG